MRAGIGRDRLRDSSTGPSPAVRRLAVIAMGVHGDTAAGERLVEKLERNLTAELVEALAGIGDDDTIVHLRRCAERHPALAKSVFDALHDMESAKAEGMVRRLEALSRLRLGDPVLSEKEGMPEQGDRLVSTGAQRAGRPRHALTIVSGQLTPSSDSGY